MPRKVVKPTKEEKTVKSAPAKAKRAEVKVAEKPTKAEKPTVKAKKETKNDTGSIDFQIKNFSDKIAVLTKHLKEHSHDFDSRRGLLIMVGKRRRLLNYLKKTDLEKYQGLIKQLKLKK